MSWLILAGALILGFFTALHVANNGFQFQGGGDASPFCPFSQ